MFFHESDEEDDSDYVTEESQTSSIPTTSSSSTDSSNEMEESDPHSNDAAKYFGHDDASDTMDVDMDMSFDDSEIEVYFHEEDDEVDELEDVYLHETNSITIAECFNVFHPSSIQQANIKQLREAFAFFVSAGLFHHVWHALRLLEEVKRLEEFMISPLDYVSSTITFFV